MSEQSTEIAAPCSRRDFFVDARRIEPGARARFRAAGFACLRVEQFPRLLESLSDE